VAKDRALLEAERGDGAERAGGQLRVLEPELLLDAVRERRVSISMAGAQADSSSFVGGIPTLSSDAGVSQDRSSRNSPAST